MKGPLCQPPLHSPASRAFTLTEILVSVAILSLLTLALLQILNQSSKIWTRAQDKSDALREARAALHRIAADLRRAHITAYSPMIINPIDDGSFLPPSNSPAPPRSSIFFIAKQPAVVTPADSPFEINDTPDLCAIGYYEAYYPDNPSAPPGPTNPSRFNLYRYYRGSQVTTNYIIANRLNPESFWSPNKMQINLTSLSTAGLGLPEIDSPILDPTDPISSLSRRDDIIARNVANLKIILESSSPSYPNATPPLNATHESPPTPQITLPKGTAYLTSPAVLFICLTAYSDTALPKINKSPADWSDPENIKLYGRTLSIRVDLPTATPNTQ
ncbi:MAG: prepilin-type N-terminal cleavage/methylation domain-containing protein [Methylacidiphilales bacterium]|nr:prepilin-type N-terminal cleavage/methylation domain-containing protein [Candidatus Methylacidiphilales bacterium]MDW8349153.1 prepilin-type N-terminal cleavage/methylation domain-containing protein [Verrucomicrobiae bacterium]